MPYSLIVFFSVLRLVLFFMILFAWIGPRFLKDANKMKGIDKMLYTWIGIGGTIIVTIFGLTVLHMYDLISLFVVLFTIPVVAIAVEEHQKGTSFRYLLRSIENRIVSSHIVVIESIKDFSFKGLKNRFSRKSGFSVYENRFSITAVIIGIVACVIRIIPVVNNAAPFTRTWYSELEGIKNLRLQQYFNEIPIPKGMHSIVGMFSTLTQVGPELTLSLLGSLTSFLLTVIIFWIITEISETKRTSASLFGASIFAIFPTAFLPISLEAENGTNAIALALCFALPTVFIFIRNLRNIEKAPWFYVTMGILATGLTNIFVLLMVLFPFLVYGLFALPAKKLGINILKITTYLFTVFAIALSPYVLYLVVNQLDILAFFEEQLLATLVFSYFPFMIAEVEDLSTIYLVITGVLFLIYLLMHYVEKKKHFADVFIFFAVTASASYLYSPYNIIDIPYLDMDQFSVFYSILIAVLGGIGIHAIFTLIDFIFKLKVKTNMIIQPTLVLLFIIGSYFALGGVNTAVMLPQTMPNGFFEGYYKIIHERLPYSYSTVSPSIDNVLSKNRHYYMSYDFFLSFYSETDSIYYDYLKTPEELRPKNVNIPPASIFIFVQKPPYNSIQQGILYDSESLMNELNGWLVDYKELPDRTLRVFEETNDAIIYEIVNRSDDSKLSDILMNIYPKKEGRAAKLFK